MLEGHSDEQSISEEETNLLNKHITSSFVTTATNEDNSSITGPITLYKSIIEEHTSLTEIETDSKLPKNHSNSKSKSVIFDMLLTQAEKLSYVSQDNQQMRRRDVRTNGDVLSTTEHEDNQGTYALTECSYKTTKDSKTKVPNGSSSDTVPEGGALTSSTSPRSRFASTSSSMDRRHHLGPQMICQTLAQEVRELKLLAHAALPEWLKDNDFLHSSHRPPIPCIATCFKSVFSLHSETVNIWTHLIGSLILVGITFWFFVRPSNVPYTWQKVVVFLAFFISAVACMTFSWLYHTLYCHSVQMSKLFSKLDYSGIAILVLGSFVPWLYYGFYCDQAHMIFYIASMVLLSACCIVLCLWEKFADPTYRPMRTATFIGLGLSGVIPFTHGVWDHGLEYTKFAYIATVALLYIGGALIYAFRVPERFLPGKLDIWGHSHQIFHVMVVIAAVVHYNGIIRMAEDRHLIGECHT